MPPRRGGVAGVLRAARRAALWNLLSASRAGSAVAR